MVWTLCFVETYYLDILSNTSNNSYCQPVVVWPYHIHTIISSILDDIHSIYISADLPLRYHFKHWVLVSLPLHMDGTLILPVHRNESALHRQCQWQYLNDAWNRNNTKGYWNSMWTCLLYLYCVRFVNSNTAMYTIYRLENKYGIFLRQRIYLHTNLEN